MYVEALVTQSEQIITGHVTTRLGWSPLSSGPQPGDGWVFVPFALFTAFALTKRIGPRKGCGE
jgi:hypothetical protein